MLNTILELVYPSNCVNCSRSLKPGGQLCFTCRSTLLRINSPFCFICSRPFDGEIQSNFQCPNCDDFPKAFDCAVTYYRAQGVLRDLIHRFKYGGEFNLRRLLAEFLLEALKDERLKKPPIDAFVPVPLHSIRFRERGFNQAEALAESLAKKSDLPLLRALQRKLNTATQTRFDRKVRIQNLRNAFRLRDRISVEGQHVVLVDDVLTTGATLHECAQVLYAGGASSVRALTVARG